MFSVKTPFPGVILLKPPVHKDIRGSFSEFFVEKKFEKTYQKKINFLEENLTYSKKGVLRGLHYQLPPYTQSKLVSVIHGKVQDIIVDVRKGSPTFGKYFSQELSDKNNIQIFIPRGFAHGFLTLSHKSIFMYKVDAYYHPEKEGSINPKDPKLGINWILSEKEWIQSDKDQNHPQLKDAPLLNYNHNLYV